MAPTAADHFEIGKAALLRGLHRQAVTHFCRAHDMRPSSPMYRSYYGLALALAGEQHEKALDLIQSAARVETQDALHHFHLARAYLVRRDIRHLVEELYEVLRIDPGNRRAILWLRALDLRAPTPLPFLERRNVVNRLIGRLRHRLRGPARLEANQRFPGG